MACKFSLTLNGKKQKGSVHNLNSKSFMLTLKDMFYRCYKTDDFDLPYISEEDIDEMTKNGYYDLIGAVVDGELLDMITIKISFTKKH